jgi:hypothetical protein
MALGRGRLFYVSKGDQASEAALEKHIPTGIVSRHDIAYGRREG